MDLLLPLLRGPGLIPYISHTVYPFLNLDLDDYDNVGNDGNHRTGEILVVQPPYASLLLPLDRDRLRFLIRARRVPIQ